jgi:hypothetical protein
MITAIEYLRRDESGVYNEQDIAHAMIGFAKLHCEAQAKAIINDAYVVTKRDKFRNITEAKISNMSILNAYPLDKIK